jgi:hypothetical protein
VASVIPESFSVICFCVLNVLNLSAVCRLSNYVFFFIEIYVAALSMSCINLHIFVTCKTQLVKVFNCCVTCASNCLCDSCAVPFLTS